MPKIIYFTSFGSKMQFLDYFGFIQYLHARLYFISSNWTMQYLMDTLSISNLIHTCITLHQSDAIPQGQNTNIISNHIHIYITFIRVCLFSESFWCFAIPLGQLKLFHLIYFNNAIPCKHIGNNLCWPYVQYLNMGVNKYLIMASHNIKIKISNSIAIPLFDLPYSYWGYAISSWVY